MKRTLLFAALAGCGSDAAPTPVEVTFSANLSGAELRCDASYDGVVVSDFRMFLHDIELVDADGVAVPLTLEENVWQTESVALLDFAGLEAGCTTGSPATHVTLSGTAPAGDYAQLRARIGVPFEENHANPVSASGPLTTMGMHWGWQAGYKFLRLDATLDGEPCSTHLGSTGCEGTIGDISGCARPNRAELVVALDGGVVALDVATLMSEVSCMGGDDSTCQVAFDALGLDLSTGEPRATTALGAER